jgi:hypothetical protein
MATLDSTGDTKVIWDSENADEVANAKATFDRLTKDRKFSAFRVKKDGAAGERMDSFDKNAEKVILVPQLQGG